MIYLAAICSGCFTSPTSTDSPSDGAAEHERQTGRSTTALTEGVGDSKSRLVLTDVTEQSGINASYLSGHALTILETVGGGVALADLDADHFLDVVLPGGGDIDLENSIVHGSFVRVFRNLGLNQFSEIPRDAVSRIPSDYSHACLTPDLNNDGFPEIIVTCFGEDLLLVNNGDGTFSPESLDSSQTSAKGWSTAAAALDADEDGDLDLYVARYVDWQVQDDACLNPITGTPDACAPSRYPPANDVLLRNDSLTMTPSTLPEISATGRGLGVLAADYDVDGRIDVYVANDAGPNHLYTSLSDSKFEERALWAGVSGNEFGASEGSMGVDAGDVDGDGLCDLWVTNFEYEDNSLYLGRPGGLFEHGTIAKGLSGPAKPLVGFGTRLVDLDLDGWLDIVIGNGHVYYKGNAAPYLQAPLVYRNDSGRQFHQWSVSDPWFQAGHACRGLASGDLDNSGTSDIVIVQQNAPVRLFSNGSSGRWCRLRLVGTESNRDAIGAVVTVLSSTERTPHVLRRWVTSGAGYLSQSDIRILLPIADSEVDLSVSVLWPGGRGERFDGCIPGQTNTLIQGAGASGSAEEIPAKEGAGA